MAYCCPHRKDAHNEKGCKSPLCPCTAPFGNLINKMTIAKRNKILEAMYDKPAMLAERIAELSGYSVASTKVCLRQLRKEKLVFRYFSHLHNPRGLKLYWGRIRTNVNEGVKP